MFICSFVQISIMPHRRRKSHSVRNALIAIVVLILVISIVVVAFQMNGGKPSNSSSQSSSATRVLLVTSMGNITIELYDDMPITAVNFRNLTEHGIYDGTTFNRVAQGFVIQGGDALTTKGITVPPILDELPNKHSNVQYSVAMAKTNDPNSATSQFYINLKDNSDNLDSHYSVFGHVIAGMKIVDDIGSVATNPANDGKPIHDVTIIQAQIIE